MKDWGHRSSEYVSKGAILLYPYLKGLMVDRWWLCPVWSLPARRLLSRWEGGAARSGWDSENEVFLGHEMRGPAGTGRSGVSMAGGR